MPCFCFDYRFAHRFARRFAKQSFCHARVLVFYGTSEMAATMNKNTVSRRGFLQSSGAVIGSSSLRIIAPAAASIAQAACTAKDVSAAFAVLGNDEAEDFAAIAARIIPTTETPGATEAGVIHFIDQAFANEMSDSLESARASLDEMNSGFAGDRFAKLSNAEQDSVLAATEGQGFFELMRLMTIYGFFAMSKYGGNKDHIGWDLIGFEGHRGAWQYPFGYYDAEVHAAVSEGESVDDS